MLDINALIETLRHLSGYAANKTLFKNSTSGKVEWRSATSADVSDFTEAAQDAVGAMAASSSKVSLTYVDGTPSLTPDIVAGSLGAVDIANRTRSFFLPAKKFDLESGTPAYAIRGASLIYWAWDFDSASTETVGLGFVMPADYVSGAITVKFHWTNLGAGSGNVVWTVLMQSTADTGNLDTASLTTGSNTIAAPSQNIQKISTSAVSFTPTAAPALVQFFIRRIGADAADTLANDAGLVGVTIEYLADM